MKKILFVYGYGGSPSSTFCILIREALPKDEYEVLCPVYPQEDCQKAHETLLRFIAENDIDIVIGTSLGAFIALTLNTKLPTIAINPCMLPSVELPLLKPRPGHPEDIAPSAELVASYKPFESVVFDREAHKGRWVMGLFAEQDELLGTKYKEPFVKCYDNAWTILGGHHGNAKAIPHILKAIDTCSAPECEVNDWFDFMCDLKSRHPAFDKDFDMKWLWLWRKLQNSESGEVVIRVVEGGNSVMRIGDSDCGYTPGLVEGAPIVIGYPNGGSYQGGFIESIDWKKEIFKTAQSTYAFHFVKK